MTLAPQVRVEVFEGSWRELVDPLIDGIVDIVVGALREKAPPGIDQQRLFTDELAIFARAGHPILEQGFNVDLLARQKWIIGSDATPLRGHWQSLFAGRTTPQVPIECGSAMVIRGVLAQSDLLTLLSPHQLVLELETGMLAQVGPPIRSAVRTIGMMTRAGWRPTRSQRLFAELLEKAASETTLQEN
jgi:DNA-binding transcriptional LysR family regulator